MLDLDYDTQDMYEDAHLEWAYEDRYDDGAYDEEHMYLDEYSYIDETEPELHI